MDFRHQVASLDKLSEFKTDALILVLTSATLPDELDARLATPVREAMAQGDFQFKAAQVLYLHRPSGVKAPRVLVVCAAKPGLAAFKTAATQGLAWFKDKGAQHVALALCDAPAVSSAHAQALVASAQDALYLYRHTKPSAPKASAIESVSLLCTKPQVKAVQAGLAQRMCIEEGVLLARECANLPGNHATPTYLAEQAKKIGKRYGMKVEVLDKKAVQKLGMGAFLAVAQGSDEPLRFIVMHYQGAAKQAAPIVLVGKGITFDSGGISIKPAAEMDEMKFDMGGAACVLGTMQALAQLEAKVNLVALIPTCENLPSGRAVKPGDVVTSLSGQTIEILNTDAEGRLILCDALTYAERFKPAMVIDVATLTGACVIALGHERCGMFTDDDAMANALSQAGQEALDPCWRMPLDEVYAQGLKSRFADVANVGPRVGGAITAAMFLRRFTTQYRWAHLDIAGVAWKTGPQKGATGRPVPLLTHFVLSQV